MAEMKFCKWYCFVGSSENSFLQVRTASCAGSACLNSFGDEQLAVDLLADKLLFEALKFSVSLFGCLLNLIIAKHQGPLTFPEENVSSRTATILC